MKIGIVGNEKIKFTTEGWLGARYVIRQLLSKPGVTEVVSGDCHLGGVDKWAVEVGAELGLITKEFPPKAYSWEHYKARNIQIAEYSDEVYCIAVDKLPPGFNGMTFPLCYHCGRKDHVKSGGCWTVKRALKLGKPGRTIIVEN